MDSIEQGVSSSTRIRICAVDCTQSAKALEARHLSGPAAAAVLAEGLVAAALLSVDAATPDEALSLKLDVSGPVGGLFVEATGAGELRGYTRVKVLEAFDGESVMVTASLLGATGTAQIVRSRPTAVLNRALFDVAPPQLRFVAARFLNQSVQTPSAVEILVGGNSGGLLFARGALAQKMPDSSSADFVRVLEQFQGGAVRAALANGATLDAVVAAAGLGLAVPSLRAQAVRPLQFRCRCSLEKAVNAVRALPVEDLRALADEDRPHQVICHMCGQAHAVSAVAIQAALAALAKESPTK